MRLWLFIFTQADRTVVSARVAADTKQEACDLMGEFVGRSLAAGEYMHPEPGTILQGYGMVDRDEPGVIHVVYAEGVKA